MKKISSLIFLLLCLLAFYVSAKESLNIKVDIIEKEIIPEDLLRFQVHLFRTGETREDVNIQYYIVNDDKPTFIKSESVAVEKIGSFFREIELPGTIKTGLNSFVVQAKMREVTAEAKDTFSIVKTNDFIELSQNYTNYLITFLIAIIIMFMIFLLWDYKLTYRLIKLYHKLDENDLRGEL